MMASADAVQVEVRGSVLLISLNRPGVRNAIDTRLATGLTAAVHRLDEDPSVRVGVLTGNGDGFCSGMDLKAFSRDGIPVGLDHFIGEGAAKPLIAAIEGFALAGGLELALACDLLVASQSAILGLPEVKVGLFAAGGGLLRLPRHVPVGVASEMVFTGAPISAVEAHRYGLVTRLVPDGQALRVAMELADRIAENPPAAVAASKRVLRATAGLPEEAAWQVQRPIMDEVFGATAAREGASAFNEGRRAKWET